MRNKNITHGYFGIPQSDKDYETEHKTNIISFIIIGLAIGGVLLFVLK